MVTIVWVSSLSLSDSLDLDSADGLEIPVSYLFYGHEKGVNWLKSKLVTIDKI